ncbi:tetraspanin-3-like isoform X2 [Scyliorhinus torazame]|uniref:tetraspanin-3-like isoform X2 n=1 Tax=Scyliorhinus torazame TaxID=75743 RepID=UPI003B5BB934
MCGTARISKLLLAVVGPLLSARLPTSMTCQARLALSLGLDARLALSLHPGLSLSLGLDLFIVTCTEGSAVVPGLGGLFLLFINRSYRHFIGNDYLLLPASLSFVVAGLLLLTGIIGLCVAVNQSHCLRGTVMPADLDRFNEIFRKYSDNDSMIESRAVDRLQQNMHCCGVRNYTDWTQFPWFVQSGNDSVPQSCCARNFTTCRGDMEEPELLYTQGCLLTLRDELQWIFLFTLGWVVAVCCLQTLGALMICLWTNTDSAPYQLLNTDNFS